MNQRKAKGRTARSDEPRAKSQGGSANRQGRSAKGEAQEASVTPLGTVLLARSSSASAFTSFSKVSRFSKSPHRHRPSGHPLPHLPSSISDHRTMGQRTTGPRDYGMPGVLIPLTDIPLLHSREWTRIQNARNRKSQFSGQSLKTYALRAGATHTPCKRSAFRKSPAGGRTCSPVAHR